MGTALTRRGFGAAALVGLTAKGERTIQGGFVDRSMEIGHRLRDGWKGAGPQRTVRVPVVMVGAGIGSLSAGWWFRKKGFEDFVLLEMEQQAGGNSKWGENEYGGYPWAAHYVPVPNPESTLVRELLAELGVMQGGHVDERYLCFEPQERLFAHGRWYEDLESALSLTAEDRKAFQEFNKRMAEYRASGVFRIPARLGKQDARLSTISMAQWMKEQRLETTNLRWYVEYGCRDDYGSSLDTTSAWAGIHYFASRAAEEKGPVTWPEGNGWIARRLLDGVKKQLRVGSPVIRAVREGSKWRVRTPEVEYVCDFLIWGAPTFLASRLVEGVRKPDWEYSPWLTANLVVDRPPRDTWESPAWDNVLQRSESLGYVVSNHMSLRTRDVGSTWTYYWALTGVTAAEGRKMLVEKPYGYWAERILGDLEQAHPDIRQCVKRLDVMRWGHAMVRPGLGWQAGDLVGRGSRVYLANSDMTGLSLFEQAQDRGVGVAGEVLRQWGKA